MEPRIIKIERGNEYYSMHNNLGLDFYLAYNELIDNGIDNNATEIIFETDDKSVTIIDNGTGIKDTQEDMRRVLRMYRSSNIGDLSKIGQYGVGLKDATMRLGKGIHIKSKAPECRAIEIDVPWKEINYDKGAEFRYIENGNLKQGTSITIFFDDEDRKSPPLPSKSSFKFYDNIIRAKKLTIIIDGKLYEPYIEPVFEEKPQILERVNFDGKKFDIKIGILSKTMSSALSGFHVYSTETLRYYQVGETSLEGTIDAKDGLYVSIGLYGTKKEWPVDKNKRGIINIDIVAKYLDTPSLLGKWKQKLYNNKKVEKLTDIEQDFAFYYGLKAITIGEEKRNKIGKNKGTIEPINTGRKRLEATKVSPHDYKTVIQKNGDKITGLSITEGYFDETKYLSISRSGRELSVVVNKNNRLMNQLLFNKSINTLEILKHFISISLKANSIPGNEIRHSLVDELFTQHDLFNEYK